jgi:hypothetical protein
LSLIRIANAAVSDYEHHDGAPHWVLAKLEPDARDLLARVNSACFYRAGWLELHDGARPLARAAASASAPNAPLLATAERRRGAARGRRRFRPLGDDCIVEHDHEDLWLNIVHWAAAGAFRRTMPAPRSAARDDPH